MKNYLILSLLMCFVLNLFSCKKDNPVPEKREEEKVLEQLIGEWHSTRVELDEVDVSTSFPSFILSADMNKTYFIDSVLPIAWPTSGTFILISTQDTGTAPYSMLLNEDVRLDIIELSLSTLILHASYSDASSRTRGTNGEFRFWFSK